MRYGSAPALVGLANDRGWFSSPSQKMLRYRINGNEYVVDGVLDQAELVSGVGSSQTKIMIRRSHS
jgi:type IV secretion system protein TrbG